MILSLTMLALLFPLRGESVNCAHDPMGRIFENYQSLTEEQIAKDCTYDLLRFEPNASASDIHVNKRRTSNCEKGLRKMKETSERYLAKKSQVCNGIQNTSACADASDQATCLAGAGTISANAQKGQEELRDILHDGRDEITNLAQFHRLQTEKFMRDLAALRRMSRRQKMGSTDPRREFHNSRNDSPAQNLNLNLGDRSTAPQPKPGPSPADSVASPDRSTISRSDGYRPAAEMRPQDAGVRTLDEYEKRLPYLIRQHQASLKQLNEFQEVAVTKGGEHRVMASQLAVKAANLYLSAEKLGYEGEAPLQWEKENPAAVAEAKAQMAGTQAAPEKKVTADEKNAWEGPQLQLMGTAREEQSPQATEPPMNESAQIAKPPEEDPVLESFTARLSDEAKNPKVIAERTRLRELLRQRLKKANGADSEKVPGEMVGEILAEARAVLHREPAAEAARNEGVGTLDVESALEDIEGQLRELDRQAGILESETSSLFERIKLQLKRRQKEWAE